MSNVWRSVLTNTRNALSRDAIKLLMTLSRRNARIVRQEGEGSAEAAGEAFMVTRGSGTEGRGKSQYVSGELVFSLDRDQLVAPDNGGFVLSETGRAFLRRNLARLLLTKAKARWAGFGDARIKPASP